MIQLAAADTGFARNVKEATESPRFDARDTLIAVSVGVGIGTLLFVWAYLRFRKKPEVVTPADPPRAATVAPADAEEDDSEPQRKRRRKRRRRRDHRPRNPSLQQTGGLPPPRPDDELPKY